MNKYILGNKIIEATEERYNNTFKDIGYVPYVKKVERKEETKENKEETKENKEVKRNRRIKED